MIKKDVYELTNPQKSIWNTEIFCGDTTVNNICVSGTINEVVDIDVLKKAINKLVEVNDSFRIRLTINNSIPLQFINDFVPFDIECVDVENKKEFNKIEKEMVNEKFDLLNSDLYKFKLAIFPNKSVGVILNVHHIISDSWSLGITIQEIVKIYHILKEGKQYINETFSYKEYIDSEKKYKETNRYLNDKEFWGEYLNKLPENVTIPSKNKKINDKSTKAMRSSYLIEQETMKKISSFCAENKISNYVFFMSAFSIYIANVCNTEDLILGTPILNRSNFKDKRTTGMFVTTIPYRINITEETFVEFALKNNINLMSVLRHQKYSYTDIIEDLRKNNNDIQNLYNIAISYQITKAVSDDIGDYETNWTFNNNCLNDIDIHLYDANNTGNLKIEYDFLLSKYTEEEINCHHNRILEMINQIINNPEQLIKDIEIVTKEEKQEILNKFNNRILNYPTNSNIIKLFENQVQNNPNNYAVIYKNKKLTYNELNKLVNKFARLLQAKGIKKNDIVGVYINKTEWFVISILAIQKLGAAYTPMHPDYPQDRVSYILEDCNSKLLITDKDIENLKITKVNPQEAKIEEFEDSNLDVKFDSNTLCYVIYTSGSTGKPKGVMLTHKNLINFIYNFNDCFDNKFSKDDNCLSLTNISFDVSVAEIFTSLISGAKLVIYPENTLTDIHMLCDILEKEKITFLYLPPNVLSDVYKFIKDNNYSFFVNKLLVGVEAIKNIELNNLLSLNEKLEIVNGYGPTETTICATFYKYIYNENLLEVVPIGYPLKNNDIYILNKFNNLQPVNMPGELCVSGESVSLGYLNNVEKTKEAFVNINKFNNRLFYKTGDTAYWSKEGYLNFIGRKDSQIKFRGHRIELNEINNNIKNIQGVNNSITLLKNINEIPCICSYVARKEEAINPDFIKSKLDEVLPYYMIPTHIICIDELPINKNGKIDKSKLPEIVIKSSEIILPKTDNEKIIYDKVCKLLNLEKISINDEFFSIGLDSLLAIRLSIEIYNDLKVNLTVKDIFENNTVKKLAEFLDKNLSNNNLEKIEKSDKKEYYPLSSAQKRIYYTSKMIGENNLVYNVPGAILINKILDKSKVEKCFKKIIEKQSSFRTSFVLDNDDVKQKVNENVKFSIPTFESKSSNMKNIIDEFPKPFDLGEAPLLRVELYYIDNKKTLLLLDSHHIIMDGTSLEILINDFCKLYNEGSIEDLEIEYRDYAVWEADYIESDNIKESENYWVNKFKDQEIPSINLPYDFNMPSVRSYKGNTISKKISRKDFERYLEYSKELGVSPYMFFISAFFVLLYKYTGQEEIILGSPTAGRDNYQLKNIIGMFVNNLVIDAKINSNDKFIEFLNKIKTEVVEDLMHQNYPYDMLVKKLDLPTDNSRNPLFDVMFTYQNTGENKVILDGESAELINPKSNISKFNLSLEINPNTRIVNLEYCTELFKENTIERLFEHYINTLNIITADKDITVKDIEIISEVEKSLIINKFNDTKVEYPKNKTVIELFEEQVEKTPNNIAIVFEEIKLTYKELNEKSNQLANYLKEQNINNEDVIAILLDKSLEMIIAIIAILKNGCAYLPIDIGYPKERIEYILKDSKAKLLLTSRELNLENDLLIKSMYIDIDNENIYKSDENNNLDYRGKNSDLAYIMYTSGSTGKPKGVMVENKSIVRLIKNTNYIQFNNNDKILQTGSIVFDACTFEIWGALLNGLELDIIKKEDLLDASSLHTYILKNGITILWLTAPLFNQLCEENPHMFRTVRCVLTGGDVLSCKHINMVKTANPDLIIINGYGPTENTTFSCCHKIDKKYRKAIPIGKPIANSTGYIVSKDGNLQPVGIPGELWVGGDGVARGYLNKPELTGEKFIDNPFEQGRVYKTGDLTKWNEDGTIEFLGRIDSQIKIRGFRVELSEITTIVSQYQGIKEAYTIFKEINKEKAICTYIVGKNEIDVEDLKKYLSDFLPQYMVPKYIMQVKKLPKNQNGKIDKKLLPEINLIEKRTKEIILPSNFLEEKLYNIFKSVLNVEEISIDDNFFECGGDSISAMKLQIEALKQDINITYGDIFKCPTIKLLAEFLQSNVDTDNKQISKESEFYKYDNIIKTNTIEELEKSNIDNTPIGDILLTGVTGFLGAHILDSYLKNETGIIYCLIRSKNYRTPLERLKNTLNFYFKDKYDEYIGKRIICVEGDITKRDLAINDKEYKKLGNNITTVIHSAALVKHFGNYREFEEINVEGTKNIIKFCKDFNLKLMHISTISVSGNNFAEGSFIENDIKEDINYGENKFYIGQNLENLYVRSKFLAEREVLEAISHGLKAYILRMGNLTSRFSEGKFQQNHLENAFVNRVKTFLQLGCAPEYMVNGYAEFTPIDYCGDAIIKIANHYDRRFSIFHLLNHKHLLLTKFYEILKELGIEFKILSSEEFSNLIDEMIKDENKSTIIQGIVRDLNAKKELVYESNIKIKSDFTKEFLQEIDFEWPEIDKKYIEKYLDYLISIGYLNIKLKED